MRKDEYKMRRKQDISSLHVRLQCMRRPEVLYASTVSRHSEISSNEQSFR